MRDLDRWKDKMELTLDGRQIFFLFFGGAVVGCLLFVLGVAVGKRMEARALAVAPAAVEDPLAALDQLGDVASGDDPLTYHRALMAPKKVERPAAKPAPAPRASEADVVRVEAPPSAPLAEAVDDRPSPAAAVRAPQHPGVLEHFTIQLSAFPDKGDADDFMRKVRELGFRPFVVASEVPGRGVYYRVRVGDFNSKQAALDAKQEFERKHLTAYVARL